jgi:Galactose oxidase, central domain/Kelch motif
MLLAASACGGSHGGGGSVPAPVYMVGGTISGLTAPGLVLTNGSDSVAPDANAATFTFATAVTTGATYEVAIKSQPSGLTCTVTAGAGKVGSADISSVAVTCPSPWIWISGSNTTNALGMYGTQGLAASGNIPGARYGAASGTDSEGNLWLFGGFTYFIPTGSGDGSYYSDLWKFAPSTGLWTWVSGASVPNSIGVYGTQGIAAAGNAPGARQGAISWIDSAGNFWLFGGTGYDSLRRGGSALNDLWEFTPSSGLWNWVSGSNVADAPGVYGTSGVAAAGNVPPAREGAVAWLDGAGNLWLFSGVGLEPPPFDLYLGVFNDLWRFNPATGLWTWVSGIQGAVADGSLAPAYGTEGVAAPGNAPIPRVGASGWTDNAGNLWVFGGQFTVQGTGTPFLNDLWKFTPSTGLWAWISGSNKPDPDNVPQGVYGSEGTPAASNVPGARRGATASTDSSGTFWLFGGDGMGANPDVCCGQSNDLWQYNPSTGQWVWISGAIYDGSAQSPSGVYGTQGAAAVGNVPGGRVRSASWTDTEGHLWLFGGNGPSNPTAGENDFNDLWKFTP